MDLKSKIESAQANGPGRWVLGALLTAVLYAVSGKLGLLLAIPPGYASPIFPASGIALSILLLFGRRYWPGIFLGSFLLNFLQSVDFQASASASASASAPALAFTLTPDGLYVAGSIAVGATLQALLGHVLVAKFTQLPLRLTRTREILLFMSLGGPISCLLNSLVGPLSLLFWNIIPAEHFMQNAAMWWLGDTIGVLVVSPIMMALFGRSKTVWKRRRLSVALPMLGLLVVTILFYLSFSQSQQRSIRDDFDSKSDQVAMQVKNNFENYLDAVLSVERHFTIDQDVSRDEYAKLVFHSLDSHRDLKVLNWIPRVKGSEKAAFEESMRLKVRPDYAIFERNEFNENIAPSVRDEYFPFTYIEPSEPYRSALGFNVASEPRRRQALEMARDSGRYQVKSVARVISDKVNKPALFLVAPVFKLTTGDTVTSRRTDLRGYVSTSVRIEDIILPLLSRPLYNGLKVTVSQYDDTGNPEVLATFNGDNQSNYGSRVLNLGTYREIAFGDYKFTLIFAPNSKFISLQNEIVPWVFMVLGLLLAALLGTFLLVITGRNLEVENLVADFEQLADSITQLVWTASADGSFQYCNKRWFDFTSGRSPHQTVESWHEALLHEDDRLHFVIAWKSAVQTGVPFTSEFRLFDANVDDYRWFVERSIPVSSATGDIVKWISSCTDIHDQKSRTQELEEAKLSLELTHEAAQVGTWDYAISSGVLSRTAFHDRMYGYPEKVQNLTLNTLLDRVHPDDKNRVAETLDPNRLSEGTGNSMEYRVIWPDGSLHWISYKSRFIRNEQGAVVRHVGTTYDVTTIRDAEEQKSQLAIREKAAIESSRLKSDFLACMSHEIRTPINGVLGMTNLVLDTTLTTEQKNYVTGIKRSGEALLTVINDILDFSKIEAGKLEFENVPFELFSAVDDAVLMVSFNIKQKGLDFKLELDPNLPLFVKGDAGRLRQILTNLLSNAVKFTSSGTIQLQAHSVPEHKNRIRFEILDSGIGISPGGQQKLFQSFSQADSSTTRRYGGTGLGLSICKNLVEKMGGTIGVESTEGLGSTFRFTVELEAVSEKEFMASGAIPIDTTHGPLKFDGSVKVLVVEDVVVNQIVAKKMLEKFGLSVDLAVNGLAALEAVQARHYDLVFMDCQMPVMDGYESTRLMRETVNGRFVTLPIVAMTANAMKGELEKCLAAGMNDHVSKPIDSKTLQKVLRKWLCPNKSHL
ncbi:MAG: CHASE domain-containing protein [Chitinophagaceae bacterium]|nr:CHASE domain-containing protein [Oligoflexus sp.]